MGAEGCTQNKLTREILLVTFLLRSFPWKDAQQLFVVPLFCFLALGEGCP